MRQNLAETSNYKIYFTDKDVIYNSASQEYSLYNNELQENLAAYPKERAKMKVMYTPTNLCESSSLQGGKVLLELYEHKFMEFHKKFCFLKAYSANYEYIFGYVEEKDFASFYGEEFSEYLINERGLKEVSTYTISYMVHCNYKREVTLHDFNRDCCMVVIMEYELRKDVEGVTGKGEQFDL